MSADWLSMLATVRLAAMIPLLALIVYALIIPNHCNYRPLLKSLLFYHGLVWVNTYIKYYIDKNASDTIVAVGGTIALLGLVAGLVVSVRSRGE